MKKIKVLLLDKNSKIQQKIYTLRLKSIILIIQYIKEEDFSNPVEILKCLQ